MELGSYFLFLQEQIKDIIIRRNLLFWRGTMGQSSTWRPTATRAGALSAASLP
jgi:hypothetical protein